VGSVGKGWKKILEGKLDLSGVLLIILRRDCKLQIFDFLDVIWRDTCDVVLRVFYFFYEVLFFLCYFFFISFRLFELDRFESAGFFKSGLSPKISFLIFLISSKDSLIKLLLYEMSSL
jgi:hypothetical protein